MGRSLSHYSLTERPIVGLCYLRSCRFLPSRLSFSAPYVAPKETSREPTNEGSKETDELREGSDEMERK